MKRAMRVWLNPNWQLETSDSTVTLRSEKKKYVLDDSEGTVSRLVEFLAEGPGTEALEALTHTEPTLESLVRALRRRGLIIESPSGPPDDTHIHARQWGHLALYAERPDEAQRRLGAATVMVMGVGGTGSVILQHLVGAGVSRFVLVDSDSVQLNNLNRQFTYDRKSVGDSKLIAAQAYIESRVSHAEVSLVDRFVTSATDVDELIGEHSGVDFIAICIDQPIGEISDIVTQAAWQRRVPTIFGGVGMQRGFYGPVFAPDRSAVSPEQFSFQSSNDAKQDPEADRLRSTRFSFGPNNTIVGAWMASAIVYHLAGITQLVDYNSRRVIDFETGSTATHNH
ncbi:HesA/MoeB/ThiF family protein [Streptomyces sp. NPDC060006]|uniref:HesA/MoeB/ThiF family protein n=1 Tax=unclassified Streptomyces TaxID=2593676 RepID=UPI003631BC6A